MSDLKYSTANACFWTAFGFGTMDYFIVVPNGLGAILGFIQMILCLIVPRQTEVEQAGDIEDNQVKNED